MKTPEAISPSKLVSFAGTQTDDFLIPGFVNKPKVSESISESQPGVFSSNTEETSEVSSSKDGNPVLE